MLVVEENNMDVFAVHVSQHRMKHLKEQFAVIVKLCTLFV